VKHASRPSPLATATPRAPPTEEPGETLLLALLTALGTAPIAGALLGGDWSARAMGVGVLVTLLSGRELLTHLRALLRARP